MRRLICAALLAGLASPASAQAQGDEQAPSADGITLDLAYTADLIAGGGARGIDYLDNIDLTVTAQTGNTRLFAYALYNNGRDFSGPRYPRGWVASNIETGVQAVRLYEAWIEQSFADGKVSLRAGLYDLNAEFDALEASGLFINPAHGIGTDFSQSGRNGPSIFPVTSLGLRAQFTLGEQTTLRLAVLDGVPGDPVRPRRTAIKLGKGDGALLAAELDRKIGDWRLIAGYWGYTAPFEDPLASAQAGAPVLRKGAQGAYLRGEGLISGAAQGRGLDAFFRLGWANGRFHAVEKFASAGLRWRGPIAARPNDQAGIAVAWSGASHRAREALALGGEAIARRDWAFEATYALALTDWLSIQLNFQYFIDPAFERNRRAVMGGVRINLAWGIAVS
jgi:porin